MIEIRTYDIPLAELIIIARCMQDHPDMNGKKLASLMGISKSNFYRKVKLLSDPNIQAKLIDVGYTLSFVQKINTIPINIMKTLGGASFIHNGIKQDYHYRETIQCLAELCDKVVIVDAGSDDGTYEDLIDFIDKLNKEYDTSYTKIKLLRFSNAEWHEQKGREKLSYFSNKAIEALDTEFVFYLQMDEILHEESFPYVRMAIEHDVEGYFCQRLNLWKDPYHVLNVPQQSKPCSTEVLRLVKQKYRCVDDAESCACPNPNIFGGIDLIQIWHFGFVRDPVKHLVKIKHMQTEVFLWGDYDEKAKNCDRLIPDRWFSDADLIPIPRSLPKFITQWAADRYPSQKSG